MKINEVVDYRKFPLPNLILEYIPEKLRNNPDIRKSLSFSVKRATDLFNSLPAREAPTGPNGYAPAYYACKAVGFTQAPRLVSKDVIDKLIATGKYLELWRGIGEDKWVDNFKYTNNSFMGGRNLLIGIWTAPGADGYKKARGYAGKPENLLRMAIPTNIRLMKKPTDDGIWIIKELYEKIEAKLDDEGWTDENRFTYLLIQCLSNDFFNYPTIYAALEGYEGAYMFKDELVIFNRSKLIIQKEIPKIPE